MAYEQTASPNFNVSGIAGYCLIYGRAIFNAPAGVPTAYASWLGAVARGTAHENPNFPTNVAVPLYFTWTDPSNNINEGHIVVFNPADRQFYSTPASGQGHIKFSSIAAVTAWLSRGHGSFLGWTEDVNGLRIIRQVTSPITNGDEMITSDDQAAKMYALLRPNSGGNADEIASTVNRRTYAQFVNDAQAEVAQRNANLANEAQQIGSLTSLNAQKDATIAALQQQLQAAQRAAQSVPAAITETPSPVPTPSTPKLPTLTIWQRFLLAIAKTKVNK